MGWLEFALAFAAFFLSHSVPVRPSVKPAVQRVLGAKGFTAAYSALSLAVLAWLIGAAGRAPFVPLWTWAPWQNVVVLGAMLAVCLIVALAIGRPNPFSFGGGDSGGFDPARPGIVGLDRHPLLIALAIWSGAHLVANGDLGHALLFGTFLAFALAGRGLIDRRKQREMGAEWDRLRDATRSTWRAIPPAKAGTLLRLALGTVAYAALIWLHPTVIGVSPLP